MRHIKVVVTDHGFPNLNPERTALGGECDLVDAQCKTAREVALAAADADALLVQFAPVDAQVIDALDRCRVIVRYGIGTDNVDLVAARRRGIPVANVPDYCIDEVADHSLALALALARQLQPIDRRTRGGEWKLGPVTPMPAFQTMLFATAGLGRIARAVLERASPFGFRLGAYDPYVREDEFAALGVRRLSLEDLFANASVLSLHLPLSPETLHFVNRERLASMRADAVLVNTSRGPLVDTRALAAALSEGVIAGAGLDVFEKEPLPDEHPIRSSPHAILTSHVAWYSEQSLPRLQQLAAEEVRRALQGEPLRNPVYR